MSAKLTAKELTARKLANHRRATEDRRLTHLGVHLLGWLIHRAGRNTGIVRRSQEDMAKAIGAKRRAVQNNLNSLVGCGYLVPIRGNKRGSIQAHFVCPDAHADAHPVPETGDGDAHPDAHVPAHADAHPVPKTASAIAGSPSSPDLRTQMRLPAHLDAQTCAPPCAHSTLDTLSSSLAQTSDTEPGAPRCADGLRSGAPPGSGGNASDALGPLGAKLRGQFAPEVFEAWFARGQAELVEQNSESVTLAVRSKFFAQYISNNFEGQILTASGAARLVLVVRPKEAAP
jgi:hypothetical protein